MQRILALLCAVLLILLSIGCLLFAFPSHVIAASLLQPTPDPNEILNRANDAVNQAVNDLNVANTVIYYLGLLVAIAALGSTIVSFVGVRFIRQIEVLADRQRSFLAQQQSNLESIRMFQTETLNKQKALLSFSLGELLISQENIGQAIEVYKRASNLLPDDAQINYLLGRIYDSLGYYDDAIRSLEVSLSANPDNLAEVQKELGQTYYRRWKAQTGSDRVATRISDIDKAIEYLRYVVDRYPTDADTLSILGELNQFKGDYKNALAYYRKALYINPTIFNTLSNAAVVAWYLEEINDAKKYCALIEATVNVRTINRKFEGYSDYYDQALAQLMVGKISDARESYKIAIKQTSKVAQFNSVLDKLYLLQKSRVPIKGLQEVIKLVEDAKIRLQ